ncbi:Na+/H+ antiporter NhaA [Streptomyces hawaiiensis]|uniref:Na+/H+ antiporter NhaA n=1 Tax=Streptomyces hawaiiensis TaxID=67305 RepID=UPI0036642DD7
MQEDPCPAAVIDRAGRDAGPTSRRGHRGKALGVFGETYLAIRFTRARLGPDLAVADVSGPGRSDRNRLHVSLLNGELAYPNPAEQEHIKAAVLLGSPASALAATILLRLRNNHHRRLYEAEVAGDTANSGSTPLPAPTGDRAGPNSPYGGGNQAKPHFPIGRHPSSSVGSIRSRPHQLRTGIASIPHWRQLRERNARSPSAALAPLRQDRRQVAEFAGWALRHR